MLLFVCVCHLPPISHQFYGLQNHTLYLQVGFSDLNRIREDVIQKAVDGMKSDGHPYKGSMFHINLIT